MLQFLALIIFGLPFPNVIAKAAAMSFDVNMENYNLQQMPLGEHVDAYDDDYYYDDDEEGDEEPRTITMHQTITTTVTPTRTITLSMPTKHYGGLGYEEGRPAASHGA